MERPSASAPAAEVRQPPSRFALRAAIALAVAGLLLWFVVPVTAAGILRNVRDGLPAWVQQLAPYDARSMALSPQRLVTDYRRPGVLDRMRAEAVTALLRDPTVVQAVNVLGVSHAIANDAGRAERAFLYSQSLSRRDLFAQLWLIERNVQRNDIRGALAHYDTVLRTSPPGGQNLFPLLAAASRTPAIAAELNRLLRARPNWGRDFLTAFLLSQTDPAALYTVTRGVVGPGDPAEREHLALLLRALVGAEAFDLAWRAHLDAWPGRARAGPPVRNGDFSEAPGLAPFDWGFAEDPAKAAERRARSGGDFALYLPTGVTSDTEAARQLVRLAPGSYVLTGAAGGVAEDEATRPLITISCARRPHRMLASLDLPVSPETGRRFAMRFAIPADCAYQWVSVRVRGSFERQMSAAAWVDAIRIGQP